MSSEERRRAIGRAALRESSDPFGSRHRFWSRVGGSGIHFFMLSGTGTPRKRAPGKVGAPAKEMKNKGSETEAEEHQRSDGHDEEAFEDKCGRAPTQH